FVWRRKLPDEKRGTLRRKPNPHRGKRAKARFRSRAPHLVRRPVSSNVVGYSGTTSRRSHLPHPSAYSPYFGLCPARTSGADSRRAGYGSELKPQQHRPPWAAAEPSFQFLHWRVPDKRATGQPAHLFASSIARYGICVNSLST